MPGKQQIDLPVKVPNRVWEASSLAVILLAWLVLQIGGLFSPGLLDDVDSIYIQIAREMLQRHDFITPMIDGIRFFDKPPLMYWMAAGSMHLFGIHDWAARIPLALGVLALLLAVYALGIRLYASISPETHTDRAGLYAALAMATSIGPYLYTRFYIPDILIGLWMTLAVHLFLIAVDRTKTVDHFANAPGGPSSRPGGPSFRPGGPSFAHYAKGGVSSEARPLSPTPPTTLSSRPERSAAERPVVLYPTPTLSSRPERSAAERPASPTVGDPLPMVAFGAVLALSVLTKGLIGIVFPIGFVLLYLTFTRQLSLLHKLKLPAATASFLLIAAPWHILAALRNPAIAMPPGLGLPARAGWAWFYLYNEHIARFLGRRIPHDYGQVPIPLFWLLLILWLFPWAAFLPAAVKHCVQSLREPRLTSLRFDSDVEFSTTNGAPHSDFRTSDSTTDRTREAALSLLIWAGLILGFFTLSSRQEYYHLPALPALALMVGGLLAAADRITHNVQRTTSNSRAQALRASLYMLAPLGTILCALCGYYAVTAPAPAAGMDLNGLLSSNPEFYNLSLGHIFDLTAEAMGFFRGPLLTVALCMAALGPGSHVLRRHGRTFAANLVIAAAMTGVLLAAHEGLVRFYPTLGSKDLAAAIERVRQPGDLILLDGELTSGSTLLFYTVQPVHLVNGRVNGPWFGSFWPGAPHIFEDETTLHQLWTGPHRVFLLTYNPRQRIADLGGTRPVRTLASSGGKTILTNQ